MKKYAIIIAAAFLFGCTTPKQMTILGGATATDATPSIPEYIIAVGDMLQISFSTIVGDGAVPYNSNGTEYVVRNNGFITMPVLGDVSVVGKTTHELEVYLMEQVKGQIKQPMVRVTFSNARISVLGEVRNPSNIDATYPVKLLEALSIVGGPTKYARLDNILVQRNENGELKSYRINLNKDNISTSPCYYLQKGDVLYIAPRIAK